MAFVTSADFREQPSLPTVRKREEGHTATSTIAGGMDEQACPWVSLRERNGRTETELQRKKRKVVLKE